jgi:predicted ATP-grasp superfamily ATP-dependent carboligase
MKRVLLTDALQRQTLAAARSLGSKGINVLTGEKTRFTPAAFSRYSACHLLYPDPVEVRENFLLWLVGTLRKYPDTVLFPIDEPCMDVVMQNKGKLEKLCHLPLPSLESYTVAADKALSVFAAQRAGLACPRTLAPDNLDDLSVAATEISYPAVIKPRRSSGSRGIRIVNNRKELLDVYMKVHNIFPYPIIQEYIIPGDRFDAGLLYNNSRLRAFFVQKEIRHFPVEMGVSTVQESIMYPELVEYADALMREIGWHGVAEVEFMMDKKTKQLKFMEINPRFWGSLNTAIVSGVDFPWLLYRLTMDGDVEKVFSYQTGVIGRWLLPGDILHFLLNKDRDKMVPPLLGNKKEKIYDDTISRDDPFPTVGFMLTCLRYLFDSKMWRFMFRR